jgi:hypothetical protein
MSTATLTAMPEEFAAGTTLTFLRSLPDFSPSDWEMTVYLAGPKTASVTATDESGSFRVTFPAATTSGLAAGTYTWVERLTHQTTGEICDAESGIVVVAPNVGTAADGDLQTFAQKTLPIVEAAIEGRLPRGVENYQVYGRAVGKIPIADLMRIRIQLQAEVAREQNPGTLGRTVKVHFPKV